MSKILAMLVVAVGLSALDTDVTGKWSGSVEFKSTDGDSRGGSAYAVFKQTGQEVTGTAGPSAEEQHPIENGRLEGNKLTFQVSVHGDPPRAFKLSLNLVSEDKLEGDIEGNASEGGKMAGKVTFTREK